MKKIRSTRELRRAVGDGHHEFWLILAGGGAYSQKTVWLLPDGRFNVKNHIDGSTQRLTSRQLHTKSNIGKGMRMGALVCPSLP